MKRKRSLSAIRKECLRLWGRIILARDQICVVCKEKPSSQPHHIFPRSRYRHLHFDLRNGAALCIGDHYRIHHDPVIPILRLQSEMGERFCTLTVDAHNGRRRNPYTRGELENIHLALTEALNNDAA